MVIFIGPPKKAIRNKPISSELEQVLTVAAENAGIDTIQITSGGQDALGEGSRRTGSTRHDRGRAADLQCLIKGKTLAFSDQTAPDPILAFITAAASAGATGIGAGVSYMGNRTIHVGFGKSLKDKDKLTWGAGGRSDAAPKWLRDAASVGWAEQASTKLSALTDFKGPGRYIVVARDGLKLRGGPGTDFGSEKSLPAGTELYVVAVDNLNPAWVQVDLEGDTFLDGYVFSAFLTSADPEISDSEEAPEPN